VEACFLGQAVQAGAGPNPAREAARAGGLPAAARCLTLNAGWASGLEAVLLAAESLVRLAVAGGVESASGAPYLLPTARFGTRMGAAPVLDALLQDAPWPDLPPFPGPGPLPEELAPLDGGPEPLPGPDPQPGDGAALVLLGDGEGPALARILATGRGGDEGEALREALRAAGLAPGAVDLFELDRCWPGLDPARVNRWGGAPARVPGAEGARRVVALAHRLHHGTLRYGLAALACEGQGLALILERP
jgi:acetyl-CoA acetyltransferase